MFGPIWRYDGGMYASKDRHDTWHFNSKQPEGTLVRGGILQGS